MKTIRIWAGFSSSPSSQKHPLYFLASCEQAVSDPCETLQVGDIQGLSTNIADRASSSTGRRMALTFSLFRSAGEPGKNYKDELLKVVESMK